MRIENSSNSTSRQLRGCSGSCGLGIDSSDKPPASSGQLVFASAILLLAIAGFWAVMSGAGLGRPQS